MARYNTGDIVTVGGRKGTVIQDLNEVVAMENAKLRPGTPTDNRERYLALVRYEDDTQEWLDYNRIERV